MDDYKPLDLSEWCNEGIRVLNSSVEPKHQLDRADLVWRGHTFGMQEETVDTITTGLQSFRGIPFLVGHENGIEPNACFIDALDDLRVLWNRPEVLADVNQRGFVAIALQDRRERSNAVAHASRAINTGIYEKYLHARSAVLSNKRS